MDEGLAWVFLGLGLGVLLAILFTVALIVYCWQKKKRRIHVEKVTINDSFDSPPRYGTKIDAFDAETSSPRSYLHVFEGLPIHQKNFFAPPPTIEITSSTPIASLSIHEEPKTELAEVKHEFEPTVLTSVVVIDDATNSITHSQHPPDPPKAASPLWSKNDRKMVTNYFLESSVEENPPEPIPHFKSHIHSPKERPFFIDLKEATEKIDKIEAFKGATTMDNLVEKRQSPSEDDLEKIYAEFESLNRSTVRKPCSVAESQENIRKNRFYDILPYDFNRVKLVETDPTKSDYINATYIKNDIGQLTHIAAQGPIGDLETVGGRRDTTIRNFWRMIWQEEVSCIVTLTLCVEGLRHKSASFWPEFPDELVAIDEDMKMTMVCITEDEICFQREILLEKIGYKPRMVVQWQFVKWSDGSAPENVGTLLDFLQRIREKNYKRPILVHCSAGIGRTGVFMAIDLLLDNLDKSKPINVYEMVQSLRHQRSSMVQTPQQYATIYEAIALAIRNRQRLFLRDNSDRTV